MILSGSQLRSRQLGRTEIYKNSNKAQENNLNYGANIMKRMCIRLTCLLLAGVLVVSPGAAGLFDWLIIPDNLLRQSSTPQPLKIDSYEALMQQLYKLNTPEAIKSLNAEMDDNHIDSFKVRVYGIPGYCEYCGKNFYVVRNIGVVKKSPDWGYGQNVLHIDLTYSQVMQMYPYLQDGKVDFFDRWQLYAIYKIG